MKKIFFILLLFSCCVVYCQNDEVLNLITLIQYPTDSCVNFKELKLLDNLQIRNVGEFFGTDDNYISVEIDNKSPHYIKGELLKYDTSHSSPVLYVRHSKCCGGDITLYKCFSIDIQHDTVRLKEQLSVADAIEITQQKHMDSVQHFLYNGGNRLLRTSPKIDEETWVDELRQRGNAFGKIYNGAEGYILSQNVTDKKEFCLVVIKKNNCCLVVWSDQDDTYFLCWIEYSL